jgi:hypothetical protein
MADGELLFKYAKKLTGLKIIYGRKVPLAEPITSSTGVKEKDQLYKKMAQIYHARSGSLLLCARNSG